MKEVRILFKNPATTRQGVEKDTDTKMSFVVIELSQMKIFQDAMDLCFVFACCLLITLNTYGISFFFTTYLPLSLLMATDWGTPLVEIFCLASYSPLLATASRGVTMHTCMHLESIAAEPQCSRAQFYHVAHLFLLLLCECIGADELALNICYLTALHNLSNIVAAHFLVNHRLRAFTTFSTLFFKVAALFIQCISEDYIDYYNVVCGPYQVKTTYVGSLRNSSKCYIGFPLLSASLAFVFAASGMQVAPLL
jgi:hypothetical protein